MSSTGELVFVWQTLKHQVNEFEQRQKAYADKYQMTIEQMDEMGKSLTLFSPDVCLI